jgi:hypothetical protein
MSQTKQEPFVTLRQQKVLDQLRDGARTWHQIRAPTKINDDNLGITILELMNQRKIWTAQENGVRFYGLERRVGLVPRFSHPERRSADSIETAKERWVK